MRMRNDDSAQVYVWDLLVRVLHWSLVVAFTIAFVTEDDTLTLHVWAGYAVGALVVVRVVWGFVGPTHARFGDFVYQPRKALDYLKALATFRAKRYLGHSPAGGAMVVVLLIALALTVSSGILLHGARNHAGPLAEWFPPPVAAAPEPSTAGAPRRPRRSPTARALDQVHDVLANLTLALVLVHLGGVALASLVHRENLPKSMLTGTKRGSVQ